MPTPMPVPVPTPAVTTSAVTTLTDSGLPQVWVDWAQIGGAVFTALGVLTALAVAISGGVRQRRADHRDQASRVSAHVEVRPARDPRWARTMKVAVLINASPSPVYNVVVGAGHIAQGGRSFFTGNANNHIVAVLPPGMFTIDYPKGLIEYEEVPKEGSSGTRRQEKEDPNGQRGVTLTFVDNNGITWERDARGALTEIRSSPKAARELTEPMPWAQIETA